MGLNDFLFGTPPTTNVQFAPGFRAPGYGFAKDLSSYLRTLIGQPAPSYPGQVDPGLSPTMQMLGRLTQGYSTSPAPQIMGQVAGTLGRYMNPQIQSPLEQLGRQIQNPFVPGGGTSPGGRPGVMPGSDAGGFGMSRDGTFGGAPAAGAGGFGGSSDGGGPTVDFNSLKFPQVSLPTDARPMFQGIDMPPHGTPPIYAGGPMPAGGRDYEIPPGTARGVHTPPTIGPIHWQGISPSTTGRTPPIYARDPGRVPGRPGPMGKPKSGGGTSTSRTTDDPRLAEIRRRVGARPRRGR